MISSVDRYHFILEHSAVSLWEEDISSVRSALRGLVESGVTELATYLLARPEFVQSLVRLIEVIDVNRATLTLYRAKDKRQLLGPLLLELDDESRESFVRLFVAISEGASVVESESAAHTTDGHKLSLLIRSYIPSESEPYPYMLVNVIDISERKAAERETEQLRQRMEFILGATKTRLDIIDASFTVRYVDPAWEQEFGHPSGRKCYEYFAGAKDVCPGCGLAEALRTKKVTVSEELLPKEGNRPVQVTSIPFQDEHGEWMIAEVNVDISERKRMEEKDARNAALVESSDDAIVGLGMDRLIAVWNKGAERIYGWSAGEILGKSTALLIPPGLDDEARIISERLAKGETIEHFETVRRRKDGTVIDVSVSLSAVKDRSGSVTAIASVARDISEQKALRARVARAQKLESLAILGGGVAHQFNNINTVIAGYLELIEAAKDLSDTTRGYAAEARKGVERAVEMTDRLMALTEGRRSDAEARPLDELVRPVISSFEKRIADEGVTLYVDLPKTAVVAVDAMLIRFVVTSLIANALDSMLDQPERTLSIRVGAASGFSFVEVGDTGCGISSEDLPRLFSPFFSRKGEWAAPGSPQARLKGVGLSLAVCHVTITERGGRIEAQSGPGPGATFRVLLPSTS